MRDEEGNHIYDIWDVYKCGIFSSKDTDDYIKNLENNSGYKYIFPIKKEGPKPMPIKKKWYEFWK